ncbi:YybH family protein [Oxalobacteraceae bacterium A2-2]
MGTSSDFPHFLQQREQASTAFVNGDYGPLGQVSTQASPATIFGPKGDCVQGAEEVNKVNQQGAGMFGEGSENAFEIMHKASDGVLAYWVGIQRSKVSMKGKEGKVPMDLRVTEIFRREDGQWKLIHRHADQLAPGPGA